MVPCDGNSPAAIFHRPLDNIFCRPIVLDKIKIGRSKILQPVAAVAHERHALEEDFGQGDRRAAIQVYPAIVQLRNQPGEEEKIPMAAFPDCRRRNSRMIMDDISPDRHMNRYRNAPKICL